MDKWIGNHPTVSQKALKAKYKNMLEANKWAFLGEYEKILKIIEGELSKEKQGILALTDRRMILISQSGNSSHPYSSIHSIRMKQDEKNKHEWKLSFYSRIGFVAAVKISKNDDFDEFFYILNQKVQNPERSVKTTVTHDFNCFLHAERLKELRKQGVVLTPFLQKRDDQGTKSNGLRLLKERHPHALFIIQGNYAKEKTEGNFIVVDDAVYLYQYDDKEKRAALLYSWTFGAFNGSTIDYFALKTVVAFDGGELTFNSKGKEFAELLNGKGAFFTVQKRKWHQKILGFRSGKLWKKGIASLSYLLILTLGLTLIFGDAEAEDKKPSHQESVKVNADYDKDAAESEEKARLAAEQKKKEEAARLEAERKAKEEAARLAAEQKKKEEAAAARVFYKNCSAVKAAGADPIRTGDPGYSRKLDRDGDGVACEW
ncbi:excalibur calcium-binding domain-containing protein [Bacillus infantis]|uniref:excalibur calcium-binding domain-containing protein n=1 Tax=Bacillus infantis TaxID=324767 RepID=UPI00200637EF|nr:excalibur calcium-binding domain-containing protein [Bacillus infantis]MCK6206364.1 excalibur calcium-binding domain-containing protein [Bacillus infantis]